LLPQNNSFTHNDQIAQTLTALPVPVREDHLWTARDFGTQ